jgi:hypothetical protein
MRRAILVALGIGTVITSAAAIGIGATIGNNNEPAMTPADYRVALSSITRTAAEALVRCEALGSAQREVCRAEAGAAELVRTAQAESRYRRTTDAARAAQRAQIEARYRVARARCEASTAGVKRDDCLIAAHVLKGRALLETQAPYTLARDGA